MEDYLKNILPEEMTKLLDELLYFLVIIGEQERLSEGSIVKMYEQIRELRNQFAQLSDPKKLSILWR